MANTTSALISNFKQAENVVESTQKAAGSADAENAKHLDSIQGKLSQFSAQFQKTSVDILDSGLVKGTIGAGTGLLGFLDSAIDKFGLLTGVIGPVLSLLASSNNINIFGTKLKEDGSTGFTNIVERYKDYRKQIKDQSNYGIKMLEAYFNGGKNLTGLEFEKVFEGVGEHIKKIARDTDVVEQAGELSKILEKVKADEEKATSAGARFASTLKNIGAAVASFAAWELAFWALGKVITGVQDAWDKAHMSFAEASEVTSNVIDNYDQSSKQIESNMASVEGLRDRFEELSRGVSASGENISLTTDQYQEYQDIVNQLVSINPSLIQGYNDENQAIIDKNNSIERTIELLKQQRTEEAKNAVYGGTSENDENLNNAQAAYVAFQGDYKTAREGEKKVDKKAADLFTKIYSGAKDTSDANADKVMEIVQKAIGTSYDDFVKEGEKKGTLSLSGRFGSNGWRKEYFEANAAAIKENLGAILPQLSEAGLLTNEMAVEAKNVAQEWNVAENTIDATTDNLSKTIDTAFKADDKYYEMTSNQQQFLTAFSNSMDAPAVNALGDKNAATNFANAMMKAAQYNDNAKRAMEDYIDLMQNRGSMAVSDYQEKAQQAIISLKGALRDSLSDKELAAIDFRALFGLDTFQTQVQEMRDVIKQNFENLFDGATFDGTSLSELFDGLGLDDLSMNQLSTLNSALTDTGDRASEFAARLAALAQAGALPEALDAISKSLASQTEEFHTVSDAIAEYQTAMEGVTDNVQSHEDMVSIYDDFVKSVNKGQINTEEARNQMDLLIGKVVSLDEARQWVKDNEGLFLTGSDENNVGQDLTGIFNTLHSKYDALSADQKNIVDGLMNVDWDTGSIQVAQHDVVALANAFGISAASMQQALDLIGTYSDYVPNTVSSVAQNISVLNDETYRMKQAVSEADQATTKAWDHMSSSAKIALETFTEGMNVDVKSMSVSELDSLVAALNTFKANIGGDTPTFESLKTSLESVKTSAGEAAASVSQLEDGSWSIDISSVSAFAAMLGTTDEEARIVLNSLAQIRDESGNPIQLTIEGNTADAERKGNAIDEALAPIEKERNINVNSDEANNRIKTTIGLMSRLTDKTIIVTTIENRKTQTDTSSGGKTVSPGSNKYTGGEGYTGRTGKMVGMASGGRSLGGKTLVGELGPEQWISRDGKHSKIVGKNGMEVIDTKPGDAIVPANLTAGLLRGGISGQAPGGANGTWSGASANNALKNFLDSTGGTYTNWTSSNSGNKSSTKAATAKVEVTADTSQLDDAAKESLDKIKEEVNDIFDQLEHKIYLIEEQHGDPQQIVAYYEQIMDEAHKTADKYRAQGQKDSSEYVREMQKKFWSAHDAIIDTMKDMYDKITSEHENAIKLIENQLDRALDTDKLNKAYQRATRFTVDTKQFTDIRSIMKETSAAAAASMASLGTGLGSLVAAMSSAQRVINSMQPMTVDVVSSVIDGDTIENYLNQTIEHYRAMQENVHKEADYYRSQGYSDLSDEVSELSDKWWEYEDAVKDVKQKVIDYLSDIVDKASESVDEIQDVLSTFKDAAKEYSTNGGFISVDTFQEIVKLGPEYLGYLQDENGLLAINEDVINRVIRAKTEQMALESASAYVERLRLALQQDSIEDLNHLLTATADLTEVQWGSVYAQLAMLNLTSDGYAAAVHNIDALRSLAYNAMSGVGIDFDDAKDGIDEIYEYVKEMIKDNVDRQVDALEELKDKYSEIIDLKKESLKASKDEADYQDEVADKVKEMAKLQEKINALSLDDSRSSIAKRKELEEQLEDAQKELSKTQADEAYDKQTDNLDKMQEAYEKEKDAEIKKLQESIQSAQKLDDAARKYIRENWSTLYDTLYKWNYEYGSHLSIELESSWDKALKAAKQYGDYLTALDAIGSSGSSANKAGSSNIVGPSNSYSTSEAKDISNIVEQMKKNSDAWHTASDSGKDALHDANEELKQELKKKYDLDVTYDSKTGTWGVDGAKGNLYNKYLGVYHSGGVVGDAGSLRQDEMLAVLQKGELVLDKGKQKSLDNLMKIASVITSGISTKFISPAVHAFSNFKAGYNQDAVPVNNNQSVNITFGDTVINGEKGDTLKQHEAINRRMVNEIIDVLKIKK